jgi:cytochrome b561
MNVSVYSRQRVWLHWLSAIVIVWTLASGFYVAIFEVPAQVKHWVGFVNVSLTTVFIPFFVWRFYLFVAHSWQSNVCALAPGGKLALLAHALIYLAIGVVLMTGVLMMDRSIEVFGVVQLPQPMMDPEQIGWFFTTHIWSCIVLSLLVLLHVGAVIVHELCNHQVLRRMSFCSKRRNGLPE